MITNQYYPIFLSKEACERFIELFCDKNKGHVPIPCLILTEGEEDKKKKRLKPKHPYDEMEERMESYLRRMYLYSFPRKTRTKL
jgi:hypothetical protein